MAEGFARIPQNILNGKERTPTHTHTCAHTNIYCISDQLCSAARLPTWSLWFLYGFPLSAVHLLPSANTHVCWTLCLCINSFTQTPPRACQVRLQSIRIHSFPIDFCSRFFFFLPKTNFYEYKCDALRSLWPVCRVLRRVFDAKGLFWKICLYRYFAACQRNEKIPSFPFICLRRCPESARANARLENSALLDVKKYTFLLQFVSLSKREQCQISSTYLPFFFFLQLCFSNHWRERIYYRLNVGIYIFIYLFYLIFSMFSPIY